MFVIGKPGLIRHSTLKINILTFFKKDIKIDQGYCLFGNEVLMRSEYCEPARFFILYFVIIFLKEIRRFLAEKKITEILVIHCILDISIKYEKDCNRYLDAQRTILMIIWNINSRWS